MLIVTTNMMNNTVLDFVMLFRGLLSNAYVDLFPETAILLLRPLPSGALFSPMYCSLSKWLPSCDTINAFKIKPQEQL